MLQYDFENSLGHWICNSARLFEQAVNDELEPHGITFRQCQVLAWLAFEGDLSQSELAERMRIEPPTLVGILDRMEREDWICRESDPVDRRRKIIRPQPKAAPVWSQIVLCADQVRDRARAGLSDEQLQILKELLTTVHDNLAKHSAAEATSDQVAVDQ